MLYLIYSLSDVLFNECYDKTKINFIKVLFFYRILKLNLIDFKSILIFPI